MPQQDIPPQPIQTPPAPGSPFEIITPQKNNNFKSKRTIAVIAAVLFLVVSVGVGAFLVQRKTHVVENAAPATAIYIIPGSQTQSPGANFTFNVDMDTETNSVTGVDVRLNFDPAVIQILSLEQGSALTGFSAFINTYDNTAGTISYVAFNPNSSGAIIGSGLEILKINAVVNSGAANGDYNITFDPATAATALQEGQNVIVSKTQGTLSVTQAITTASPSPEPTDGPTSNPTATAVPTSAPTATASPISTATPTTGPTTPGATHTPTPVPTATSQSQANATATPTTSATTGSNNSSTTQPLAIQSSPVPIPVTGTDWPTLLGIVLGLVTIMGAFMIAI